LKGAKTMNGKSYSKEMRNKSLLTVIILFIILSTMTVAKERIAVMPFGDKSNSNAVTEAKLTSLMEEKILKIGEYEVVNRADLGKILDEQKLVLAGMIDEKSAVEIGKIAGAKMALVGSVNSVRSSFGWSEITAEFKIINVETAIVYKSINTREKAKSLDIAVERTAERFYVEYIGGDEKKKFEAMLKKEALDNSIFVNVNGGFSTGALKGMKSDDDFVYFTQKDVSGAVGFGLEIGKNIDNLSVFADGGINLIGDITGINIGAGAMYKIAEIGNIDIKTGAEGKTMILSGKIGKLTDKVTIAGKDYAEGSEIRADNIYFGAEPFVKAEYYATDNISIFGKAGYNIYFDNKISTQIKDKLSGNTANTSISGFKGTADFSGIELKTGIEMRW
jgi:hypothetical protein